MQTETTATPTGAGTMLELILVSGSEQVAAQALESGAWKLTGNFRGQEAEVAKQALKG